MDELLKKVADKFVESLEAQRKAEAMKDSITARYYYHHCLAFEKVLKLGGYDKAKIFDLVDSAKG